MSRSNPTENSPNPSVRWFEWNGEKGNVRYYDKQEKENQEVTLPFPFVLLDRMSTIKGWHKQSDSGIYSNEVKDTRTEPMLVKAFKGGVIAEGLYGDIKDEVIAAGGHFTTNLYIMFLVEQSFEICSLQFKGAALRSWMEFDKKNRSEIFKKSIVINDCQEGKKGSITFQTPVFELEDIAPEDEETAIELDKTLQTYLAAYLKRPRPTHVQEEEERLQPPAPADEDDDEIPF